MRQRKIKTNQPAFATSCFSSWLFSCCQHNNIWSGVYFENFHKDLPVTIVLHTCVTFSWPMCGRVTLQIEMLKPSRCRRRHSRAQHALHSLPRGAAAALALSSCRQADLQPMFDEASAIHETIHPWMSLLYHGFL